MRALKALAPPGLQERGMNLWGAAGENLVAEGVEAIVSTDDLAVMGFAEVAAHYGVLSRRFRALREALHRRRPNVVILIDYPGFNLDFAREARDVGALVCYHIAPKAWAHGAGRAERLAASVDLLTCILPFEEEWFRSRGVRAHFVGNPLFDATQEFLQRAGPIAREPGLVALLPGSRRSEISRVLPVMVQALFELRRRAPDLDVRAAIPVAPTLPTAFVREIARAAARAAGASPEECDTLIRVARGEAYELLARCSYAWVCSGTATLEAALLGAPQGVVFRMSATTFQIAKRIVKLRWVSLVNLCADEMVAPEFLQHLATPGALAGHAQRMLDPDDATERDAQAAAYSALRARFPPDAAANAARLVWGLFEEAPREETSRLRWSARRRGGVA